jgi:hypothetical protein
MKCSLILWEEHVTYILKHNGKENFQAIEDGSLHVKSGEFIDTNITTTFGSN